MSGLRIAFKEWAVITRALLEGRQSLILRKGGISEQAGEFRPEYVHFWLFPTFAHQQRTGIVPELIPLLDEVERTRPAEEVVRLEGHVEVAGVYRVNDLEPLLRLAGLHGWSEETVRARFAYRTPGLYVLPVRTFRLPQPVELPNTPYYAGCKSWVELEQELPALGKIVQDDQRFAAEMEKIHQLLGQPTIKEASGA